MRAPSDHDDLPRYGGRVLPFPNMGKGNEQRPDWADVAADGCGTCDRGRLRCPCPSSCLLRDVDAQYRRVQRLYLWFMVSLALVAACAALVFFDEVLHAVRVVAGLL
ncbi:MAG: hypothetical protein MUF08_03145 [Burkholderiaceae bacterium]|jgi:hypothetical protein|nr:hypothetical protein [Burkholderiaceae bacterium]MCU0964059.1 hypothetical protein [Burkholderiaceae bacterium]